MDEIMVPKKWVVAVLVIIGLGAGLLWGVPKVLGRSPVVENFTATQAPIQEAGSAKTMVLPRRPRRLERRLFTLWITRKASRIGWTSSAR